MTEKLSPGQSHRQETYISSVLPSSFPNMDNFLFCTHDSREYSIMKESGFGFEFLLMGSNWIIRKYKNLIEGWQEAIGTVQWTICKGTSLANSRNRHNYIFWLNYFLIWNSYKKKKKKLSECCNFVIPAWIFHPEIFLRVKKVHRHSHSDMPLQLECSHL